ncbi:MAG: GNAT family N-acetyltransferase [Proteobacteria bacterium]|nr:GNAT family N-acetyltransferase [Pseudomonadota bacterium]MCH8998358.1 GNAT family N-acetyltransferase [Pseudomonadota bacterium]
MRFQRFRKSQLRGLRLERNRVYLRFPVQRDWRNWAALRAESRDFLAPWEPTWAYDALTRGAFRRRLRTYKAEMRQGVTYSFLILRRVDDVLLGGITLSNLRRGVAQSATLGYWIGASHGNQGYMTDSLAAVLEFAFSRIGLHRVEAACLPANEASRRLLLRCGFREEGYAREYLRISGRWQDHQLFAILRDNLPSEIEV